MSSHPTLRHDFDRLRADLAWGPLRDGFPSQMAELLLRLLRFRLHQARLLRHVQAWPAGVEIDPDGVLDQQLAWLQRQLIEMAALASQPWWPRWLAKPVRALLAGNRRALARIRRWMAEHDADASPLHGPYRSAEALLEALDRDE